MIATTQEKMVQAPVDGRSKLAYLHGILAIGSVLTLVGSCTVEGPIRLLLVHLHAESLLYLRDAIAVAAICSFFFTSLTFSRLKIGLGIFGFALFLSAVYGLSLGTPPKAVAMGIKVFLPIFLGGMFTEYIFKPRWTMMMPAAVGMVITLVGLQWSALRPTPWSGIDYEAAGITVEGTRAWMIDGIDRLAGFARSSGDASNLILLFFVLGVSASRSWINFVVMSGLAVYGLHLTTMRSAFMGLFVVMMIWLLQRIARSGWVIKLVILASMAAAILAPWVGKHLTGGDAAAKGEGLTSSGSMMMRVQEIWPDMTSRFHTVTEFVAGLGLGSVGVPQKLFDVDNYNPADNMPLYALAVFGIGSVAFHVLLAGRVLKSARGVRIDAERLFLATAGMAYAVGAFMNGFESVPLGIALGLMFGLATRSQAADWETDYA